jgi:hypothetical protein
MNKEDAAKELGISVRSLQRLTEKKKISVTYKRGVEALLNSKPSQPIRQSLLMNGAR